MENQKKKKKKNSCLDACEGNGKADRPFIIFVNFSLQQRKCGLATPHDQVKSSCVQFTSSNSLLEFLVFVSYLTLMEILEFALICGILECPCMWRKSARSTSNHLDWKLNHEVFHPWHFYSFHSTYDTRKTLLGPCRARPGTWQRPIHLGPNLDNP